MRFDANGGEGGPSTFTKYYDIDTTLSEIVPTREGYTFVGWDNHPAATFAMSQPGDSFVYNGDITLYAVWQKNTTQTDAQIVVSSGEALPGEPIQVTIAVKNIKDVRDKLEDCLNGLIGALNAFADLYDLAPVGEYEVVYDFGDITYNQEEDRARWYGYVTAGRVPFWFYLVKFEGMTEADAKALVKEAQPKTPKMFGGEE